MKKLFLSILLLCCCIVFTGCGGNSNSYDGAESNDYRIYISNDIINKGVNNTKPSNRAASSDKVDVKLFLNGVEFPGHSYNEDSYIFTKVMYSSEANRMFSNASYTIKLDIQGSSKPSRIVFEKLVPLPENISAKNDNNDENKIIMYGDGREIDVYYYNDIEQAGLTKVKRVSIEKLNSLTAKVTFFNAFDKGVAIDYDSWMISGVDSSGNSGSYTYSENEANRYFLVTPSGDGDSRYYTITLTYKGEAKADAGNHTLDNTEIQINKITKGGKNVVDPNILNNTIYKP